MPLHGEVFAGPLPKPQRGSWKLEREQRKSGNDAEELAAKKAAKAQDGRCRWPERHKCRGGLEGAHVIDKSRGGANAPENILTLCAWIHRSGPESIHSKDLAVQPLTKLGTRGPCAFYRRVWSETKRGEFSLKCIGREVSIGIMERE
jgi:hypothetical protein